MTKRKKQTNKTKQNKRAKEEKKIHIYIYTKTTIYDKRFGFIITFSSRRQVSREIQPQ